MIHITRDEEGCPQCAKCKCGNEIPSDGPGRDFHCDCCGLEFNSSGQQLADRRQWGEETGETAMDYYAGINNPEGAFDGDY